jgi:hypothetical protein
MFLYDDVEVNENNNYENINLNIFAFNDQDLERMINEVNVFVDNSSCENVLSQTSSREDRQIADSNTVLEDSNTILAESDTVLAESDIVLAKSNIVLAESNIVFANSNIIFAKLKIILAESNVIVSKNEEIREDVFEVIFEKIVDEVFDESSFEEISSFDEAFNEEESSSLISRKKQFEIELLNNLVLFTSTFSSTSTNTQVVKMTKKASVVKTARKASITSIAKKNTKNRIKITKLLKSRKFKFHVKRKYIIINNHRSIN